MADSIFAEKALDFSAEVVNEQKRIAAEMHEYSMSDQMKRAATAIGASHCEAQFAESDSDFVHKLRISLKEANEANYWLRLLNKTKYISDERFSFLSKKLAELIRMLVASINTTLKKIEKNNKKKGKQDSE